MLIFSFFFVFTACQHFENMPSQVLDGKKKYSEIAALAQRKGDVGICWANAISLVESTCKSISETSQQTLAVAFTSCHLRQSGRKDLNCDFNSPRDCTSVMSDSEFGVYTDFFTHTRSMCYFVSSELWQLRQEAVVNDLANSAANVLEQLHQTKDIQSDIYSMQQLSLSKQEEFIEQGDRLKVILQNSSVQVKAAFDQTIASLHNNFGIVLQTMDQLKSLLIGEFTGFHSLIFYVCSLFLSYVLTSSVRTYEARSYLLILLTIEFFIECFIIRKGHAVNSSSDFMEKLYRSQWAVRKLFAVVCGGVLLYFTITYQDLNRTNFKLLVDIQKRIEQMSKASAEQQLPSKPNSPQRPSTEAIPDAEVPPAPVWMGVPLQLQRFMSDQEALANCDDLPDVSEGSSSSSDSDNSSCTSNHSTIGTSEYANDAESLSSWSGSYAPSEEHSETACCVEESDCNVTPTPRHTYNLRPRKSVNNRSILQEDPEEFAKKVHNQAKFVRLSTSVRSISR